jgi:hypothetical protein
VFVCICIYIYIYMCVCVCVCLLDSVRTGPPGTGKTTSILCLAHELLGAAYKEGVLELNASDDRSVRGFQSEFMF